MENTMIKLYSDDDLWDAVMQKRRLLAIFLSVLGVWLIAVAGCATWYALLPYEDPMLKWVIVIACVITAVFFAFAFPFMGISYKRSKAYVKMLKFFSAGLKECCVAPFEGVDDWITHDGVDVNVADFSVPNIKRDGMMTRQIYIDGEKDFPPFEEGVRARMIVQGNLLLEYEILPKEEKEEEIEESKGDSENEAQ